MRFGVGDFSGQRPPGSPVAHRRLYAELLEQGEQIEAAGLDSMWVSEHHFAEDGYMPSVLPIVAALLARTSRITAATDRLLASLHDPIRLAEDAIALDLLSGGRFILGLSLCYRDEEFSGFGVEAATDPQRLEALVPVLRAAFDGRAAVIGQRHASITPRPVTGWTEADDRGGWQSGCGACGAARRHAYGRSDRTLEGGRRVGCDLRPRAWQHERRRGAVHVRRTF